MSLQEPTDSRSHRQRALVCAGLITALVAITFSARVSHVSAAPDLLGRGPAESSSNTILAETIVAQWPAGFDAHGAVAQAESTERVAAAPNAPAQLPPADLQMSKSCYARPISGGILPGGGGGGGRASTAPRQADADVVYAGQQWICDISVSNFNAANANDITITDTVKAGLTYVVNTVAEASTTGAPGACTAPPVVGPGNVTCTGVDVPAFSTTTFQLAFKVSPAFVATAPTGELPVSNRACITVTGTVTDPNLANNCDTETDIVKDLADLRVSKISEPHDQIFAGQVFTYTIFVDNLGPSVSRNVTITDTLLSSGNVSVQSCAFSVSQGGGTITQFTCTTGNLVSTQFGSDVGTFRTSRLDPLSPTSQGRLRASFRLVANSTIDVMNTTRVSASTPDPDMSNNFASDPLRIIESADLQITKFVEPEGTVRAGRIFTYTIFVDNLGPSIARHVVVTDTLLSSGLVSIQSCAFSVSQGGGSITQFTCTTGPAVSTQFGTDMGTFGTNLLEPFTPTSQGRLRASFRLVANGDIDVTNAVRVTSTTPDPNMSNNFASVSIQVTAVSDLSVTKQATAEEQQTAEPGLIFNNAIFGQVFPTAPNYFVSTRVTAGRRILYQLNIRDDGPSGAENVVVSDRLPFGVRIYQGSLSVVVDNTGRPNPPPVTLPAGTCVTGTPGQVQDQLKCGLGVLNPGATATITFQVITDASLPAGAVIENDVMIYSDTFDPNNANNFANAQNTVLTASDLSVAKSAVGEEVTGYDATLHQFLVAESTNRVTAGKILRYQLQVQNNGPSDSQNVTLQDDLPPVILLPEPVTFLRAEGASCRPSSLDQQRIFCTVGQLAAGARRTFDVYVRVDPNATNSILNTVTALQSGSNTIPPGAPPALPGLQPTMPLTWDPCVAGCSNGTNNNVATNTTTVTTVADVFVTKVDVPARPDLDKPFEPDLALAGKEHRYQITIGNDGPSVARSVNVTDLLDFKQPGILGETFVRCEPIDTDDLVSCSFTAPNTVTVTHLQVGNENVIPTAGTGTLVPGKSYGFYLITSVDSGYVLDGTDTLAEDTANITTATTDFRTQNNTDRHQTLIVAEADLAITKTDLFASVPPGATDFLQCDPVMQGGTITYTVTVTNKGPSDAAEVFVVDQLPAGLVLDPAQVTITVNRGQIIDLNGAAAGFSRDDGRIEVLAGNDPSNSGVLQIGRMNAPGTPGAGPVIITIVVKVPLSAPCGTVFTNTATVTTRQNDALWPPAPQPFPGINGGPRTPTFDPNILNNAASETTTLRCPSIKVRKTVSFDGKCPGQAITVINQTAQPVTFCFEVTNTGDTFLDNIVVTDLITTRTQGTVNLPIACSPITHGIDPNVPLAPGETVTCSATIPQLLAVCECGVNTDTVTVIGTPVNSGRTVFPCLSPVTSTDTRKIEVPCAGVDFRIQLPVINTQTCQTWIQVQNVGDQPAKPVLVFWGAPGACPPQAAGPLKVECGGLLRPGSAWSFTGSQIPAGAQSAIVYSLNATNKVKDERGNLIEFSKLVCGVLFDNVLGDYDEWVRFDEAYRLRGIYYGRIGAAGEQLVIDFGANPGEPMAATVNRKCPDVVDPNVMDNAAYTGISSDQEGAQDPLSGSYTTYAPLIFAQRNGLNSVLYIQNSGTDCTSLEIWLKAQDNCLRAVLGDVLTLSPGETVKFDPNTVVGPDWIGSAWIRSTQPLGVVVDTMGANHYTAYNGVPGDVSALGFSYGDQVVFAPLIYNQMQGWDTAIQVQNHSATTNAKVKVYFLDQGGDIIATVVDWICPRGSQSFFLPVIGGLPGNWVGSARVESQVWWTPGSPQVDAPFVSAVVMLEKWADPARSARREAVAYNAQSECLLYEWQIGAGAGGTQSGSAVFAVPLLMKDYNGITTELGITNLVPKPGFTDFAIFIYDQNGLLDQICEKLTEKQVEYINLATWGYVNPHFNGSAVVSATFWEHDVFDNFGKFQRNVVGLGGVAVERVGGVNGGPDVPGDESKAFEAFPIFNNFKIEDKPLCPGAPSQ